MGVLNTLLMLYDKDSPLVLVITISLVALERESPI